MFSDADAFLDAIWANPDDDTPRLVYADWLEEHGQADYAQFIRLSCQLAKEVLPPDVRVRLRRERYELWQAVVRSNPQAFVDFPISVNSFDKRGILERGWSVRADVFVRNSPRWWPVVPCRSLQVYEASGYEPSIGRADYMARVEVLQCVGRYLSHRWDEQGRERSVFSPVSAELLSSLASHPDTRRLTALWAWPLHATADDLLRFAGSPLAGRLEALRLTVRMTDGMEEELEVTPGRGSDTLRAEVGAFVAANSDRLPARSR
jgi:uncharacterized protein (TIGR02996 family)